MNDSSRISPAGTKPARAYIAFIAIVIFTAIWQISCFKYTLKWDAIDITLPWRYFVSDALLNNHLPWWNPFQFHGFAQGLSLETWYPLALILGAARRYDLYSLNLEYLFHLLIAAYGFYRLARAVNVKHQAAVWGALVFPLSGFFVANAQHTGWIASGAWIPHVLASFIIWKRQANLNNTLILTILVFMLLSGGYIAYSIVTAYIILALSLVDIGNSLTRSSKLRFWNYAKLSFCILCVCSLLIVCLWQLKSQIDRGVGLSGDSLVKGSLYFKHLVSFIYPFATVKGDFEFWSGDQSMMNVYLGLPALTLCLISLKKIRIRFYRELWILALASLALALAVELPFRQWVNFLPLFDLFRFPSLFRYFMVLLMMLIASRILGDLMKDPIMNRHLRADFIRVLVILMVVVIISGLIVYSQEDIKIQKILRLAIDSVSEALVLQSIVHILLLSTFLILNRSAFVKTSFFNLLMLFTAADLIVSCQLNGRVSIFSESTFASIQPCFNLTPDAYPLPVMYDYIGSNTDKTLQFGPVYRNTNTLYKRIGWDGYTPYQYQTFIDFEKTPYYQKSLDLPFLFASEPVLQISQTNHFYDSDPILNLPDSALKITSFTPNSLTALAHLGKAGTVVLNQNHTANWQVSLDGQVSEIVRVDHSLMGVRVGQGLHKIKFDFVPGRLYNALMISLFSALLCCLFYFWLNRKSPTHQLFLAICLTVAFVRLSYEIGDQGRQVKQHESSYRNDRFLDRGDLERLKDITMEKNEPFTITLESKCLANSHHLVHYLNENFLVRDSVNKLSQTLLHCSPKSTPWLFETDLRFETFNPHWIDQGVALKREDRNTYQSLLGRKYSANITLNLADLDEIKQVMLTVDHRNSQSIDAALVFSIESAHGEEILWKSMSIPEFDRSDGQWQTLDWSIEMPEIDQESGHLKVHIWNRGQSDLQIDNFMIRLLGN